MRKKWNIEVDEIVQLRARLIPARDWKRAFRANRSALRPAFTLRIAKAGDNAVAFR